MINIDARKYAQEKEYTRTNANISKEQERREAIANHFYGALSFLVVAFAIAGLWLAQ